MKQATNEMLKAWHEGSVDMRKVTMGPQHALWVPMGYMIVEQALGLKKIHYGVRKSCMHVSARSVAAYASCTALALSSGKDTSRMKEILKLMEEKLEKLQD